MLEPVLPMFVSPLLLLHGTSAFDRARAGVHVGRAPAVLAPASMFLVRLHGVAHQRLERDLDDAWHRNNTDRSVCRLLGSSLLHKWNGAAGST